MRKYSIQGVMEYAHCETREIEAKNKKEALEKFKKMTDSFIDPSMAEFQKLHVGIEDVNVSNEVKTQ